ncbi:MAG: ATP-binding protein [Gammaproteobacteria bacterium]|nr:ATP-binding protein [Gammaproteobacteria bacterium]
MIDRQLARDLTEALSRFPVVALIGPRQVGKTTLAREFLRLCPGSEYLDLERPSDRARIAEPELYLSGRKDKLVILDEVQQLPELFPVLRSLVDEHREPGRFLLLGSASPELINRSSESLAGRIRYLEMRPFALGEIDGGTNAVERLWIRGGFPNSYLAADDMMSFEWREAFVRTFLERDVPALGFRLPAHSLRRFWQMLAHWHGQLWNASTVARSLDVSPQTANRYLDLLCDAFIARRLLPWHANTGKRLVKSPRLYLRDSGLLHALLNIQTLDSLLGHPSLGASWEGFVIEQVIGVLDPVEVGFYRTSAGSELDLVLKLRGRSDPVAVEVKYSAAPKPGKGFWNALDDLGIERAFVIYPGRDDYPIEQRVTAWPAVKIPALNTMF